MNINGAIDSAMKCFETRDLRRAALICEEVLKSHPRNAKAFHLLGVIYYQNGAFDAALENVKKSLLLDPANAEAHYNLGNIFREMKRPDEAIACYMKALQLNPGITHVYMNLGTVFQGKGLFDEAIINYRKALRCDPNNADIYYNLGLVFEEKDQLDEAVICYQKAIMLDPDFADAYNNLGILFNRKNQPDSALTYYKKAITIDPNFADAHWNMSHVLLIKGQFQEGWKEYEWRWKVKELYRHSLPQKRNFCQPLWDGSDINGRIILLYAEQGFGDTIQFIRYASLVAQYGATVIVECPDKLTSLLQNTEGVHKVVSYRDQLPEFDVHCPLLSLPSLFNTTLDNIPAKVPYIIPNLTLVQEWREVINYSDFNLKIGLVWATDRLPKEKSCSLQVFSSLTSLNDISFYSLQKGEPAIQAKKPPKGMTFFDYTEKISDFSDTAAFIMNLDLVISVDTAVAHLAGALGKPVWTLLPFTPDWRWMLNREDSPWYPTMKLFRQSAPGNWNAVMARVQKELSALIEIRNLH
jgi:tetratricopeptide (TPR) repeat protein